jgi:XTP/dITP diphosphohydrolase
MNKQILVFATHNKHKAKEIEQILGDGFTVKTLTDIGCMEEIPETAITLEGNAFIKARHVKLNYELDCFSEDTGLEVTALLGAPGVLTARYAGDAKDPNENMALLLKNLADKSDRTAQFRTVIALIKGEQVTLFEGICKGSIALEPRGTGGFGYDPIFIPEGYDKTFAELADSVKNTISHRARATTKLIDYLAKVEKQSS